MSQFSSKEKLLKALNEFRVSIDGPFRLSEATKWFEGYFRREGGNVETVRLFVEFIIGLDLITLVEQNIIFSKYYFNDVRIAEFFDGIQESSTENKNTEEIKSTTSNNYNYLMNRKKNFGEPTSYQLLFTCLFEEIMNRLACLLSRSRNELIACINLCSGTSSSLDKLTATQMGSSAYWNILNMDHQFSMGELDSDKSTELISISCLEALAEWPDYKNHRQDICQGKCSPDHLMCTILSYLDSSVENYRLSNQLELLMNLIFQFWPRIEVSIAISNLLDHCVTDNIKRGLSCRQPRVDGCQNLISPPNSYYSSPAKQTTMLPPLATPVNNCSIPFVDDSRFATTNIPRKSRPHALSIPSIQSNNSSINEYQPMSPIVRFHRSHSIPSDPGRLNSPKNEVESPAPISNRFFNPTELEGNDTYFSFCSELPDQFSNLKLKVDDAQPGRKSPEITLDPSDTCAFSDNHRIALYLSDSGSPVPSPTFVQESNNNSQDDRDKLVQSIKLALLLFPPLMRRRICLLVHFLRRVLLNHANLNSWFTEPLLPQSQQFHELTCNTQKSSLVNILNMLADRFSSIVFPPSPDSGKHGSTTNTPNTTDYFNWQLELFCLLISDRSNAFVTPPRDIALAVKSSRKYNNRNEDVLTNHSKVSTVDKLQNTNSSVNVDLSDLEDLGPIRDALPMCMPLTFSSLADLYPSKPIVAPDPMFNYSQISSNSASLVDPLPNAHTCFNSRLGSRISVSDSPRRSVSVKQFYQGRSSESSSFGCWNSDSRIDSSMQSESSLDPKRLTVLGNTAHLIKLLNQIINDREMNPRRKMKCLLDFRKAHADVFWLRFGDQQTASNYLTRLQHRIDSIPQPSVFERITNALRRRRQSPAKSQESHL